MPVAFDSLEYARRLRQIGFDEAQAEGMTDALARAMSDAIATKRDLQELEVLPEADLAALESRLTVRLGSITVVGVAIVSALAKRL
jgi:hypothetical protein